MKLRDENKRKEKKKFFLLRNLVRIVNSDRDNLYKTPFLLPIDVRFVLVGQAGSEKNILENGS